MNQEFDVVIIGGGPGGYVAAIRASQLGLKTAVIEKENLGGVCLNWGCIPTKALLRSAEIYHLIRRSEDFGIDLSGTCKPNLEKMIERSRKVSEKLSGGIDMLMKKNKVTVIKGAATIISKTEVGVVETGSSEQSLIVGAKYIIVATGAKARQIKGFESDGAMIMNYRDILASKEKAKKMIVVGSGAIGLEFACFFNEIGVDVTVLEAAEQILGTEDEEVAKIARRQFEKNGIKIKTGIRLEMMKKSSKEIELHYQSQSGNLESVKGDRLLMAVGVCPNTSNLGLEEQGIKLNDRMNIEVDSKCKTNIDNIYAIGDVASNGPALAHKASHEGVIAAEEIAIKLGRNNKKTHAIDYSNVPGCIYTSPQIASVGLTEKAAKDKGIKYEVGKFSAVGNGKAIAMGEEEGMVKVLIEPTTGEILGAHMIGCEVTEMIQGFTIAKTSELTEEDLANTIFPHPTISEMMHESILAMLKKPLHS